MPAAMRRGALSGAGHGGGAGYVLPLVVAGTLHLAAVGAVAILMEGETARSELVVSVELVTERPGSERAAAPAGSVGDEPSSQQPAAGRSKPSRPLERTADAEAATPSPPPSAKPSAPREHAEAVAGRPERAAEPVPPVLNQAVARAMPVPPPKPAPPGDSEPRSSAKISEQRAEIAGPQDDAEESSAASPGSKATATASLRTPPSYVGLGGANPQPGYPYGARSRGEEGRVIVRVRVSATGVAETVQLARSSGHRRLDEEALRTVRTWRFVPAKTDGDAVAGVVEVPITFRLQD